ncbi:hypothetical protein SLE2022_130040 [Rubroshorea leprosula]
MAEKKHKDTLPWSPKTTPSSELQVYVRGVPFTLDIEILASKSAKVADFLKENSIVDLQHFFLNIPADAETFEHVARFCYGMYVHMSTENVVPLMCLAFYLEMTGESNLLSKAATYFEQNVIPSWNETIKAFRVAENFLGQTMHLGIFDACLDSIVEKALADPRLLGEPIRVSTNYDDSEDGDDDSYRPNARRRLFVVDWQEDLTTLSLQLYEPTIRAMNQHGVPSEYISASLCQYAQKWIFSCNDGRDNSSVYKNNSQRNVIETLERLLPHGRGLLPCTILFEMLRYATMLEASPACRRGYEIRIGKQLDEATAEDLLIPSQGYTKELQYDIECVKRILKNFYSNTSDTSGFISVAELMEHFLAEVASDIDLRIETFVSLAEMSMAVLLAAQRNSDGIYRAIDIYLDKHRYLTEQEKEEVCKVLDCQRMSREASEHAAKNEKLPVRVMVQVLFMSQLQLRDTITKEMHSFDDKLRKERAEKEESEEKMSCGEQKLKTEMIKMSSKVMELERECHTMKKDIESGCRRNSVRKGKVSMWRELKRKFGCTSNFHDCNFQVKKKKVHPKTGV